MPYYLSRRDEDVGGVIEKLWCLDIPSVGIEIDIKVEFEFTPGEKPQTYGPPEDCDPGTPDQIEIISVTGAESGVCCMELLRREVVPLRYPWPGHTHETLLSKLEDEMVEVAKEGRL